MLKQNYKRIALLFVCMLFILTFIGVNTQITGSFIKCTKNLGVIPGHYMTDCVKMYIPF